MLEFVWSFPTSVLAALIAVLLVYFVFNKSRQDAKTKKDGARISFHELPMPSSYPIVGHLIKLGTYPHKTLAKWSKTYGSLFRIKMGFQDVLIISDLQMIRTALLKHGPAFAGRPAFDVMQHASKDFGVAFSTYSHDWEHQKKIAEAVLKLYTTGKDPKKRSILETSSNKHANKLVDNLLETRDKQAIVEPTKTVLINVTNAICEVCFGRDFRMDDPEFREMLKLYEEAGKAFGASQIVNFWPILKHVPVVSHNYKSAKVYMDQSVCFTVRMIKSHFENYDGKNLKDITDYLLHESNVEKETGGKQENQSNSGTNSSKTKPVDKNIDPISFINSVVEKEGITPGEKTMRKRILYTVNDLLAAGIDTLSVLIQWALIYMAVFPETQEKMRDEMENVIGPDEEPSFRLHSGKCSYIVAWIYELIRHVTPTPLLLPHLTCKNVVLADCFIPKGTLIYFNSYQVHHDPKLWKDPAKFQLERFLNKSDQIDPKSVSKLTAWGLGKRKCPGQDMSKHELFILICTMLRRMNVEQSQPGIEPILPWPATSGITLIPAEYKVKITERCSS